jgi:cell division protein FtsB
LEKKFFVFFSVQWLGGFLAKTALVAVFVAILGVSIYVFPKKLDQLAKLENRRSDLIQNIDLEKNGIETLRRYQDCFEKDREFVEKIARQQRFIFKNELLFSKEPVEK